MLPGKPILAFLLATCFHSYGSSHFTEKDSSIVTITLRNASDKLSKIDSVYVIFDRFDLRGAGVVKKVFYPDIENKIEVNLPKGKYFVNIYCLGIYNKEGFERIVSAKSKKNNKIFLLLQASALFNRGNARIPEDHFDPSHLAILNFGTR